MKRARESRQHRCDGHTDTRAKRIVVSFEADSRMDCPLCFEWERNRRQDRIIMRLLRVFAWVRSNVDKIASDDRLIEDVTEEAIDFDTGRPTVLDETRLLPVQKYINKTKGRL